jgi:actin-related protein 6
MNVTLTANRTGLEQIGLPQAIAHSISLLPEELHGMFWANIGLIGGNTKLPGFVPRLYVKSGSRPSLYLISTCGYERGRIRMSELRSLASVDYDIAIYQSPE